MLFWHLGIVHLACVEDSLLYFHHVLLLFAFFVWQLEWKSFALLVGEQGIFNKRSKPSVVFVSY